MKNVFPKGSVQKAKKRFWLRLSGVLFFALILYPLAFSLSADAARIYPSAGTTSAAFLKIGAGARASAMAGAYTALSDDPYALYWNPAGLAYPAVKTLAFTHNDYFEGLKQEYFGFVAPGEKIRFLGGGKIKNGNLGLGLNYFYTPKDLERRSGSFENDPLNPISPVEGKFKAYDLAFSIGYGYNLDGGLRLGGALKFIRQSIDAESGNTAALDLGALYDFGWLDRRFTAGFAVQNLGPGVKFDEKRFPLPLTFRAGLSHRIHEKGPLVSMDLSKPIDNYPSLALGLEHPLSDKLYLRTGYRCRQYGNELGAASGFAAGLGLNYRQFSFDYAFSPFGDLGAAHRLSLSFRFQPPAAPAPKRPSEAVYAAEKLEGARPAVYAVSKRVLKLSIRGTEYEVKAETSGAALTKMVFRATLSGGEISLDVLEGGLPAPLAEKLPKGCAAARAWQFGAGFSGVNGDMEFTFRLPEEKAEAGTVRFLYLTGGGWRETGAVKAGCAEGSCEFSARAPLSSHYAAAVK